MKEKLRNLLFKNLFTKSIYLKQNFNIQTLYYTVAYFYKKEKGRLQKKLTRIKTNSTIQDLKNKYDSGVTNIDQLICADLTFRYNIYSPNYWRDGIIKMKNLIDFNENT
jgi:hypothetical protein